MIEYPHDQAACCVCKRTESRPKAERDGWIFDWPLDYCPDHVLRRALSSMRVMTWETQFLLRSQTLRVDLDATFDGYCLITRGDNLDFSPLGPVLGSGWERESLSRRGQYLRFGVPELLSREYIEPWMREFHKKVVSFAPKYVVRYLEGEDGSLKIRLRGPTGKGTTILSELRIPTSRAKVSSAPLVGTQQIDLVGRDVETCMRKLLDGRTV